MTTRLDHTACSHDRTPVARKACRARRRTDIKKLQAEYMIVADSPDFHGQSEYEAGVEIFAMIWGMDLRDAYDLIENGLVVY